MDWTLWKVVLWTAHTATESHGCQRVYIAFSVLTCDWMMGSFEEFLGQSCFFSVTSHRHLTLCALCVSTQVMMAKGHVNTLHLTFLMSC